jgi:hypothetical protein
VLRRTLRGERLNSIGGVKGSVAMHLDGRWGDIAHIDVLP